MSNETQRPPLGVMPRWLWIERRIADLAGAIVRADAAGESRRISEYAIEIHRLVDLGREPSAIIFYDKKPGMRAGAGEV